MRDNQRLELLGDAVLELIVTRALFEALPHADEGLLSRARASVVNEAALAAGARAIALGPSLLLGKGEVASGGSDRPRTLADALEAVIAAVYLAAGLEAATALVERALGDAVRAAVTQSAPREPREGSSAIDARVKDAKSVLQELVQRDGGAPPKYELEAAEGPVHERTFRVRAIVRGEVFGVGEGRSRRDAEMQAAAEAIEHLRDVTRGAPGGDAQG
jgi:ribonuclease-3